MFDFEVARLSYARRRYSFEGGVREVLTNQLGEQVGLTLNSTQTNEEAIEINPLL